MRERQGALRLTNAVLGELVGVSGSMISLYRSGAVPSSDKLSRLAEALRVPVEDLAALISEEEVSEETPDLPGGGPDVLGYLEEGAEPVPPDVWFVFDLPGGGALHLPVSVLADARRVGPPARATGRAVGAAAPRTSETATPAGQPQSE